MANTNTTTIEVPYIQLVTLRMGLKAEMRGMRLTRGQSCAAICKQRLGMKGNKASLLAQVDTLIAQAQAEMDAAK